MSQASAERLLLDRVLNHRDRTRLLDALLEWKAGAALPSVLGRLGESELDETTANLGGESVEGGQGPCVSGRYRKVRLHARGGLGEVFVACDEELQREVALKEIQENAADDAASRARFVREAEVTGNLEHPGIVPVYGLGADERGRPWYAMRFIKGESLRAAIVGYHRGQCLPMALRQLLNRFVAMCNAVGYAHSRGVIHRDIKPANVMLGEYGETLVVDWGLAKKTNERRSVSAPSNDTGERGSEVAASLDDLTQPHRPGDELATQMGEVMGTLAYMSPEQSAGQNDQIGPATDIYALGVTLYEILTGKVPIDQRGGFMKVAEKINRGDYLPPRRVKGDVPRALEAICLKAMALRTENRYATAQDLGRDIEAWLADEPVRAYREPVWDRVRRWGRRHRTLVTTGVAVLLLSVVGLTVGLGAVSAEQRKTAKARDEAEANLELAEANLKLAKKAINDTFDLAKNHQLLQQPGMQEVRKLLLEKALPFYKRFRVLKSDDSRSRAELADQWFRVGYITGEIGNKREARLAYQQVEAIFRATGNAKVAREDRNLLARTLNNMGILLQGEGKRTEALKAYSRARDIQEKLAKDNPAETQHQNFLAGTLNNLGVLLVEEGKRSEAWKAYTRAQDIGQKLVYANPTGTEYQNALARTLTNIGNLLQAEGKRAEALKAYTKARDIQQKLVKDNPATTLYQDALILTLTNMALLLSDEGQKDGALKAFRQARDICKKLVKDNPAVTKYQANLASALTGLGTLLKEEGKRGEALKAYTQARDICERLVKDNTNVTAYQNHLAFTLINLGNLLKGEGMRNEALRAYTQARNIGEKLVKDNPRITKYQIDLAAALDNMGTLLAEEGKRDEALKAYTAARDIHEKLARGGPNVVQHQSDLASTHLQMGLLRRALNQPQEALSDLDRCLNNLQAALKIDPRSAPAADLLWRVLVNRAVTLMDLKRHREAASEWGRFLLVAPSRYRLSGQLARAESLARAGEIEAAINESQGIARIPRLPAPAHYDLACVAAICLGKIAPTQPLPRREYLTDSCVRHALAFLKQADKAGFFKTKANRDALLKDPDLAALRQRDDFKQFLKTITP